jgi:hypothetical protein
VLPLQLGNSGITSPSRLSEFRNADKLHFSQLNFELNIRADFHFLIQKCHWKSRSSSACVCLRDAQPLHQIGTAAITFWPSFKRGPQRGCVSAIGTHASRHSVCFIQGARRWLSKNTDRPASKDRCASKTCSPERIVAVFPP